MYLKKLKIKNIKSHLDTEIEFHPNVNVICGSGGQGKSNVVRSINFPVTNRPSGGKMLSNLGDTSFSSELEFAEGNKVKLTRNVKKTKKGDIKVESSEYTLNDGESYTGFGQGIPDVIKEVINMSEINIQKQLDTPYLVTSSGGEFSRTVNRITNMDEADKWKKELSKSINNFNNSISDLGIENENLEIDLKNYDGLDTISNYLQLCEQIEFKKIKKDKEIETVDSLLKKLIDTNCTHLIVSEKINLIESSLTSINTLNIKKEGVESKRKLLVKLLETNEKLLKLVDIGKIDTNVQRMRKIHTERGIIGDKIKKLQAYHKVANNLTKFVELTLIEENVNKMKDILDKTKSNAYTSGLCRKYIKTINRLNVNIKEFEDNYAGMEICPLCFRPLDISIIKENI